MYNQLVRYCLDGGFLPDEQFGFLKGRSPEWQQLSMLQQWHTALDSCLHVNTVLLDLEKAFDSVDHTVLLSRLAEMGVSRAALALVQSYLSGRQIQTLVDGALSDPLGIYSKFLKDLSWVPCSISCV